MAKSKPNCFFITGIAERNNESRRRSDQIFKHIVGPAAERCGYKAIRADALGASAEDIISLTFQHLKKDAIVVADLTGLNPNVFYEVGYRRALGKPIVHLIQRGHKLPFDVYDTPTVSVDLNVDDVVESREQLVEEIKAATTESGHRRLSLSLHERELFEKAWMAREHGDHPEAIRLLNQLVALQPGYTNAYVSKGRIYLENLKQYSVAANQFKKALDVDPSNRAALYDLGLTYYHMGNLNEAIKWNQKALDKHPDFVAAIYNHAIYCVDYGEKYNNPLYLKKAIKLYKDVVRRDREYAESAMFNLAALYAQFSKREKDRKIRNQYVKEAVSLLDKAIERGGLERLRKVTGEITVTYGRDLKILHREPAYKRMIVKWKKLFVAWSSRQ